MKRFGPALAMLVIACLAGWAFADPRLEQADRVRKQAGVSFTRRYDVACSPAVVRAAVERPAVMGALWASYMYGPAYRVTALSEPGAVHVIDPTGIEGDLWTLPAPNGSVVYFARGKLSHWAVPMMNGGAAVFDLAIVPKGRGSEVTVTVSVKPDNWLAGAGLWLVSPIIKARIQNRMTNNLHDAALIMDRITTEPEKVAARLHGEARREFERAFVR